MTFAHHSEVELERLKERVARAIDLTHPAGAQGVDDFMHAGSTPSGKRYRLFVYVFIRQPSR